MRVLVVGYGGREHALVWKIAKSPEVTEVYCAPGNAGIAEIASCVNIDSTSLIELADFAASIKIDLTVIGPERARVHFQQALRSAVAENLEGAKSRGTSMSIDSWAVLIVAAINDACELRAHNTVGGRVLCGYTILGKPQGLGVTRVSPTPSGPVVDEIGFDHSQGRTIRTGWRYVPPTDES